MRSMPQRCRPNRWLDSMPLRAVRTPMFRPHSHFRREARHIPFRMEALGLEVPAVMRSRLVWGTVIMDFSVRVSWVLAAERPVRRGSPFAFGGAPRMQSQLGAISARRLPRLALADGPQYSYQTVDRGLILFPLAGVDPALPEPAVCGQYQFQRLNRRRGEGRSKGLRQPFRDTRISLFPSQGTPGWNIGRNHSGSSHYFLRQHRRGWTSAHLNGSTERTLNDFQTLWCGLFFQLIEEVLCCVAVERACPQLPITNSSRDSRKVSPPIGTSLSGPLRFKKVPPLAFTSSIIVCSIRRIAVLLVPPGRVK